MAAPRIFEIQCIYCANGIWVAGSSDSGLWYSTDGKSWKNAIYGGNFTDIYCTHGVWVAASSDGLYYSTNGIRWYVSDNGNGNFYDVHYANGVWVAGSDNNAGLYYSTDFGKILMVDSDAKVRAGELTISELTSISRPSASNAGKVLMANNSGSAVWAEPPQSGAAVQILTWEATD